MLVLILVAIIFVVLALIIPRDTIKSTFKMEGSEPGLPYEKKPYLMTNAEREFFFVLERAVQGRYYIVPQVELSKILQVKKGVWQYKYKNKINLKSVDFVLFDKEYFTPQIVIELDDSSHTLPNRIIRDNFVNTILQKTDIRFIRFKVQQSYNQQKIKSELSLF